jgi:hypothetical protein
MSVFSSWVAHSLAVVVFLVLPASNLRAQDSTFARLIGKNRFALTQEGAQFTGPGWEKLQRDVQQSQFVLVGEDHGTAQIPAFTAAVAHVLKPAVYVAEIDPYEAQDLTQLVAQPGLPTAFQQQYPLSLSFYSWAEEFELARSLRAQQVRILGVDQVNCFYAGRFYARLAQQTKDKKARTYFQQRAAAYQAHDRAVMGIDGGKVTLFHQSRAALDSLVTLTRQESPAVQQMAQSYVTSAHIYETAIAPGTGLQSHQQRVDLMKRNLLQGLSTPAAQGEQRLPKALFKFGAFHVARGASLIGGVFDVGNLALNLADVQDQQSLHILIVGKQGTKNAGFNLTDFNKNVRSYSNAEEIIVKPFPVPTGSTAWQVFDLRPLRRALLRDKLTVSTSELYNILLGYDYIIIIPETTASHNF